uniref:Uncharacterized protein n=1 Tax=Arundo donax TaxID=35708 RepID=A0A0A9AMH7_ARUDO
MKAKAEHISAIILVRTFHVRGGVFSLHKSRSSSLQFGGNSYTRAKASGHASTRVIVLGCHTLARTATCSGDTV